MRNIGIWCLSLLGRLPPLNKLAKTSSIAGLIVMSFVGGAVVMHFRQPPSGFLRRAFAGLRAWWAQPAVAAATSDPTRFTRAGVSLHKPAMTCEGLTLWTSTHAAEATLIDMNGQAVHHWKMPSARPWPSNSAARTRGSTQPFHWERCHLFPNGDLLALCCSSIPHGYGLAKFDKDSQLLWGYSGNVHHDMDVGEDGRIYLLADHFDMDESDEPTSPIVTHIDEHLVILSSSGQEIDRIPIMKAFRESAFGFYLPEFVPSHPTVPPPSVRSENSQPLDLLHVNSVHVLARNMANNFPLFKPGQVLISLRTPSVIAVLDIETRSIVWAVRGVWQSQHDAQFLDNGRILLFDNLGSLRRSRVIEYDPNTQAVSWWWGGEQDDRLSCVIRGAVQRLTNGNTLVVDSVGCTIYEVTRQKDVVWRWNCPVAALNVTGGRRFGFHELPFLKCTSQTRAE